MITLTAPLRVWLFSHISRFSAGNGDAREMLDLKRVHSAAVAAHCRGIAQELGWSAHDVEVAEAAGLLHDAGRFSQYAEFGTFADSLSVDHGARGVEVIEGGGVLDSLDSRDRRCILDAVRFHNRREIPENEAAAESLPFVRLVRDADKLDIYRITTDRILSGRLAGHLNTAIGITEAGPATPEAVDDVLGGRTVANGHIRNAEDFVLMQLSWVFDFTYAAAVRRVRERGYFETFARAVESAGARGAADHVLAEAARRYHD